jgi:anti-sigma factor RsiW
VGRPADKHIDSTELSALAPSASETGLKERRLTPDAVREAERHLETCGACRIKVSKYRQLVNRFSNKGFSKTAPPGANCPKDDDIDWQEVAAGLWPELKTAQLIKHAALCDHCGPLLRAATTVDDDPSPQEEKLLAELKAPSRPDRVTSTVPSPPPPWRFMRWLVPATLMLVVVIIGVLATRRPSSPSPLSGPEFAEVAVGAHRQHAQGTLALDVRADSQQTLNEWFKTKLPFSLTLPASPAAPGEQRPYRLEGARLVQVGGKPAAFIAYQMQSGLVSLMVTPDSAAIASGGVEANFKKVSFHYATLEGYKVVTWSQHGRTYALVSQEGNSTQQSCMVCHSAMRDRDLSQTPTPLPADGNAVAPVLQ